MLQEARAFKKEGARVTRTPLPPLQLPGKQTSAPEHFGHGLDDITSMTAITSGETSLLRKAGKDRTEPV